MQKSDSFQGAIMKVGIIIVLASVVLLGASVAVGQSQPPAAPSASTTAQQGAATTAPGAKRPPQAKTQPEFDAYKTAVANQSDPAAMEKAADDFAVKFPTSELIPLLYRATMRGYQNANNGDKMAAVAQKLLKSDPDDPEALVDLAEVTVEQVHDSDLDKQQKYEEARKNAQHALQTVDTDVPAGIGADQIDAYKGLLKSNAYSVLGAVDFNEEKFADAEGNFRKSIAAYAQADPVVVLRLALSLDKQNKYPEALTEANKVVDMTQEDSAPGKLARQERDRLVQLTGGAAKPAANAPAVANPQQH
jgi:tetratricopeptide (TPR) repeat protein